MKRKHLLTTCLWLGLLSHTGALHAQSSDNATHAQSALGFADGKAVFQHICQGCHMPDAKGATGAGTYPALAGNPRLVSAQYMAAVILHGRRDMPSFIQTGDAGPLENSKLSDAQIADVVNYVRTHFGNHYADRITAQEVAGMHP
ncbi:c-type cytochrome [Dyella acidisoli]|uniref:Cytochrome c6 n=1 Tax=Dyella acidisoli TaxID=1867834 RepID=A0ABQ5XP67_9GAMM|nr:cytochrome c [Dyella acidisoli]GLQ92979.1 cytochrome c6 [Dyella acidisoli]